MATGKKSEFELKFKSSSGTANSHAFDPSLHHQPAAAMDGCFNFEFDRLMKTVMTISLDEIMHPCAIVWLLLS